MNILFFFDIPINLLSAYQDKDLNVIDDPKRIAKGYLTSWFIIDLISVVPFDMFLSSYPRNQGTIGLSKISKMYRLIRLTRMARMFKVLHLRNHMIKNITESLKIGIGTRRLLFLTLILILLQHVVSCMW